MKLAGADILVWVIIAIIVATAKAYGKLAAPGDENADEKPIAPLRPRQRPARPLPSQRTVTRQVPPRVPPLVEVARKELRQIPEPPAKPPPVPKTPAAVPAKTATPAATAKRSERSALWVTALRDKRNLRNIIISAEIIGRPKGATG